MEALKHAEMVHRTSEEFVGHQVMLPRENLYWWEFNRNEALRKGVLNLWLGNYCATIEESFQHLSDSVYSTELIQFYRDRTSVPDAYEITG